MSSEASATLTCELFSLYLGEGVMVSIASEPGQPDHVARYFANASAPFHRWLERARPSLVALFDRLVAEGHPIVPLAQPYEHIPGVFVEDSPDAEFRARHRGGPLAVHLSGSALLDHRSLNLQFLVSTRVERARMQPIIEHVAEVLRATQAEPPAPVEPEPPPPPARSWWRRLWSIKQRA